MTDKPNRLRDIIYGGKPPKVALLEEARALRARLHGELGEREARRIWTEAGKVPRGRMRNRCLGPTLRRGLLMVRCRG